MRNKKNDPDAITVFIVLFAIVTIVAEIVILSKIDSFSKEQLGLSFIGIIATFVVISNFAHVIETRNKVNDDLRKMEGRVEKIAGLETYYNYAIKQDIAKILFDLRANGSLNINPSTLKIIYHNELTFFVRLRTRRGSDGQIKKDETEYRYFVVWLDEKNGRELTKEQFDEREAV